MSLQINSIRAITKLSKTCENSYFVLAYFLPEKPYMNSSEGEVFGYVAPLKSFTNEKEAINYRNFVEESTTHKAVFVAEAMSWNSLSTINTPLRFRKIPETLETDIANFYKRLKEQEKIRKRMAKEFEEKLQKENDPSTLANYARNIYDAVKLSDRIENLKKETHLLTEMLEEKRLALGKHHDEYPEHDDELEDYFNAHLGDMQFSGVTSYLKKMLSGDSGI